MGRRVYFSFHYQDVIDFRANVVRNSTKFKYSVNSFKDSSIWENAKTKGINAIKKLIERSLKGTSVCCVLIGSKTYDRRWVRYEIMKSFEQKKGQLGVGINWIKGKDGTIKFWRGNNPFEYLKVELSCDGSTIFLHESNGYEWKTYKDLKPFKNQNHLNKKYAGRSFKLSRFYDTYSYNWNNGSENIGEWIEQAAKQANR